MKKDYTLAKEHVLKISQEKEIYQNEKRFLPFAEKLKILSKLQEKAFLLGKTKIKPWPTEVNLERLSDPDKSGFSV